MFSKLRALICFQEAFKAIDDFHSLLNYYKKPPKPQTIVDYYQKFALVCFQSCNMVYHAAALLRVYVITRDYKKSFSQEELAKLVHVLLSEVGHCSRTKFEAIVELCESLLVWCLFSWLFPAWLPDLGVI